jgi:hypothetical protein
MTLRSVLVIGDSPHAARLREELDHDPHSRIQLEDAPLPDLVVLAGAEEQDLAVALSLIESDRPLVIVAGEHLGPAVLHRLALVAANSESTLLCWLPAVRGLKRTELSKETVITLRLDRADNRPALSLLFDDLARLIRLAGPFDQVTATLETAATVTLSSDNGTVATWTLRPTSGPNTAHLLLGDTPLELDAPAPAPAPTGPETAWTEVANQDNHASHLELDELLDVVETYAAIQESVRRRRAIDLHHEPTSERTVFKSQMAAVGCLLLLLTLLGLVALLLLGALLDPTNTRSGRADRVGFLLEDDDFQARSPSLSPNGTKQLDLIAGRIEHVQVPVVVAASKDSPLDDQRRDEVEAELDRRGIRVAPGRVVIDSPPAGWTRTLLKTARIAWIAPLVLFLLLQGLILATRGSKARSTQPAGNSNTTATPGG